MAGLASLPRLLSPYADKKLTDCSLTPLKHGTDEPQMALMKAFQYFPETLTDSKQGNWQSKEIPGGSLPIYQWVNGGERTLTFTANFSSDVDLDLVTEDRLAGLGIRIRNVDVKSALLWLRSFMFPVYSQQQSNVGTVITMAPCKLLLSMPNTGIGYLGGSAVYSDPDSVLCFMSQCEITIESWWSGGRPRLAAVQLGFTQLAQQGNAVVFPSYNGLEQPAFRGQGDVWKGYKITAKASAR